MYEIVKRIFDVVFSVVLIMLLSPILVLVALAIRLSSDGPAIHASKRVGIDNKIFKMYKFRTMDVNAPQLATHLMVSPEKFLIPVGRFLRKMSIDEWPQLINIFMGDMSFVGPRPALYNQSDLILLRTKKGVHKLVPGLTGLAQINGRDVLTIPDKVKYDEIYLLNKSFTLDVSIVFHTMRQTLKCEGVSH